MSIPMLAVPSHAAHSAAQTYTKYVQPLLGAAVSLILICKPLVVGVVHAVLLAFNPRLSLEERNGRRRMRSAMMLNRMARECEHLQPGLAGELRSMAGRD